MTRASAKSKPRAWGGVTAPRSKGKEETVGNDMEDVKSELDRLVQEQAADAD